MRILLFALVFLVFLCPLPTWASSPAPPKVEEILKRVDELYRSRSSYAEIEMLVVTPHYRRRLRLQCWTKGQDRTFIRIVSPKKDRGIATLRIGKNMWNYFPRIKRVMKVPPSMMMGSWMGSDFTNDDLVKESTLLEDYVAKLLPSPPGEEAYYYIELRPKEQTVSLWGRIILVVRRADYLPVREEYYDEKGKKVRVLYFEEIKEMGGRVIPTVLRMVPLNKNGRYTVIRYLKAAFDEPIDEAIFSQHHLQRPL